MTSYERIMSAVRHQRPDRLPIDYLATPESDAALKAYLGVTGDEPLLRRLGCDIRRVAGRYVGPAGTMGAPGVMASGRDYWGVVWRPVQAETVTYNEIEHYPLAQAKTVGEIENYAWPSVDWFDFSHLPETIDRINADERRAIMFFAGGSFESPWYMRGMEQFLLDLVESPDIAECISRHVTDFYVARAMRALEESDGRIDIVGSGGDIGSQRGMILAPDLWREHIKPYSNRLIRTFKDMGLVTFYHSCGSLVPVIEDLIGMGLDILDPIQPNAAGMDAESLRRQFGGRLVFHGGIDEQELLPHGSPDDVRRETERLMNVLGHDGGYIVCPAHQFQPDTAPANIMAIYDTAQQIRVTR
jgi:uroporphyrinogen decarboxylase